MRVVLYARYSSDRQNERSVDDQLAALETHAAARGWAVVARLHDAAISGAAMANRPGIQAALAMVDAGACDIVLVEHQDRLARNREHGAHIFNRLTRAGVKLATLHTDEVKKLESALVDLMSEVFLDVLSDKTKRGMHANAERGLATGAKTYGYRGEPGGKVSIVEAEAEVVREIYRRYAAGDTTREICADLNARGVPSPSGGLWNPSTLNGSRVRGNGLLACELYAGVKVWNRDQVVKDPETGKRVHHYRPPEDWKRTPVPELRLVDEATWSAAQARRQQLAQAAPVHRGRKPPGRGVFAGLIKCGACGSSMTAFNSRGRLICAARRERGPAACDNARTVSRSEVEDRVLTGLRTRLLKPAAVRAYIRLYTDAWSAEHRRATARILPLQKRLGELDRTIARLVASLAAAGPSDALINALRQAERDKAATAAQLAAAEAAGPPKVVPFLPNHADTYAQRIAELHEALAAQDSLNKPHWPAVIEKARGLVQRIDIAPGPRLARGEPLPAGDIVLHGTLARFVQLADNANEKGAPLGTPRSHSGDLGPSRLNKMVAGGGYSLTQTPPALRIAC